MKISIITPMYAIAGVPLAQIRFAKCLAARGHTVELIIGRNDTGLTPPRPEKVKLTVLNKPRVRDMLLPLTTHFRIEKPDVIFSAEDHLTAIVLIACIFSGCRAKVSGSSRVLPTDRLAYSNRLFTKGWALKQTMRLVLWRADALTCVSKEMVYHYQKIFKGTPHICVYNIIKDESSVLRSIESVDHPWIVNKTQPIIISAGTLTKRKGFSDLISAFSILRKNRICRLIILGEGYLRNDLENLILQHGLKESVDMPGNVGNPLKYFSKSDVFVLSSYAEGLPNVLIEAMLSGCTPVSTDCPTGPKEVLQEGRFGYLTPMADPIAMANTINFALDHPISKNLLDEAVRPFEAANVIERHFEVLGIRE